MRVPSPEVLSVAWCFWGRLVSGSGFSSADVRWREVNPMMTIWTTQGILLALPCPNMGCNPRRCDSM